MDPHLENLRFQLRAAQAQTDVNDLFIQTFEAMAGQIIELTERVADLEQALDDE